MSISIWYRKGLNKYLSDNGFNHFATRRPVIEDFDVGRAYMINIERKTIGLKDMIANENLEAAKLLSNEFELTGKLSIIEEL